MLLLVEFLGQRGKSDALLLPHALRLLVDLEFALLKILGLFLQIQKPPSEKFNFVFNGRGIFRAMLLVSRHLNQELLVLLKLLTHLLVLIVFLLLLVNLDFQFLNSLVVLLGIGGIARELGFLLLLLVAVANERLVVVLDHLDHVPLFLKELVFLLIQLLRLLDNVVLLLRETVVDLPLLAFLLQQPHGLQRSLAFDDEGTHFVEVFVCQLLGGWLLFLIDEFEQSLDFSLVVDVHLCAYF